MRLACFILFAWVACAQSFDTRWEEYKRTLSSDELYRLLWSVPKGGDLHNHHEYSIPMTFWIEGAITRNYYTRLRVSDCKEPEPLQWLTLDRDSVAKLDPCLQADFVPSSSLDEPQRKQWLRALTLGPNAGRDEFFERIVRRLDGLEKDPQLMADSLVIAQRQLRVENAIYLETQLDPRGFTGLTNPQAAQVIRRRLKQSDSRATGVTVRMQLSTVRFLPDAEDDLKDAFAFIHANHDLWVGTNLVGREDNPAGEPARYTKVLSELRKHYPDVALSLHAGESSEPDSHVADSLALGATRIGHGINAYRDPRSMDLLRTGRYLIEINLVSNLALGYTPDLRRHPFPQYLRQGVPVCLNTDDRGILQSNLTDEYFIAVALFNLSWREVVQLGRSSLEFSFAEPKLKRALLRRYERNVANFERHAGRLIASSTVQPSAVTPRLLNLRKP